METKTDFIFGGSKITADGDCTHEIKRCLLLGRKVMTHLDSILKSRDITLPTKVCLIKAVVFPVVMYGCESWTIKKAKCWKIDTFKLWYWRRHQSWYSLEGLMLKLKLQYSGHLMQRTDSLENTVMLGKIEGKWRRGQQRMRWFERLLLEQEWNWDFWPQEERNSFWGQGRGLIAQSFCVINFIKVKR